MMMLEFLSSLVINEFLRLATIFSFLCAHQLRDFSPNCKNTNSIIPNSDSNDSFEFEFESVFRRFDCICAQIDVKRKERNLKNRFIVFASRIVLFSLSQCLQIPQNV